MKIMKYSPIKIIERFFKNQDPLNILDIGCTPNPTFLANLTSQTTRHFTLLGIDKNLSHAGFYSTPSWLPEGISIKEISIENLAQNPDNKFEVIFINGPNPSHDIPSMVNAAKQALSRLGRLLLTPYFADVGQIEELLNGNNIRIKNRFESNGVDWNPKHIFLNSEDFLGNHNYGSIYEL